MKSFIQKVTIISALTALPAFMVPAVASNDVTGLTMNNGVLTPAYGQSKITTKTNKGFNITNISNKKVNGMEIATTDNVAGLKTRSIIGWEMDGNDLVPIYGDVKKSVTTRNVLNKKVDDNDLVPVYGDNSRPTKTKRVIGWEMDGNDLVPIYQ